jgi:hypothetical protein
MEREELSSLRPSIARLVAVLRQAHYGRQSVFGLAWLSIAVEGLDGRRERGVE